MVTAQAIPELLRGIGYNSIYWEKLVTQCQREGGIVPFVGAGMSAPFGFPQWGAFLLGTTPNPELKAAIQQRLEALEFEEAASLVREKLGWRLFEDLLQDAFNDARLPETLTGAVTRLARFRPGPVVTTNFDRVLERVFKEAGRELMPIWHSQAAKGAEALQHNRGLLLKMHGDWEDSENRVLTREEYQSAYGDLQAEAIDYLRPLPQLLNILLPSRSCLFLGCSLKQDRTMRMLRTIARQYRTMHFAVVEKPKTEEEFQARTLELSNLGLCPIWYPHGAHELIDPLLEYLAAKSAAGTKPGAARRAPERREPPNNIPRPPTPTVGRGEEIHQLISILSGARLVMVFGCGGGGKSRVAMEVAYQVRFEFPDGVCYVDLADLSERADKENLLPARIGSVAGVPPARPPLEGLIDHFAQGQHLLVLDNCEHLAESCRKLLSELLARCPGLHVLGTSRTTLMLAEERVYPLSTLETPDSSWPMDAIAANESVQLFKARAGGRFELTVANASMIAELCRKLDGIPLAIEVAAARLGVCSVAQMTKESGDLMGLLKGVEVDDLRQWHTVNAALEWSYNLLSTPVQHFLRSLVVFDGGWTEERATALYAKHLKAPGDTMNLLQKLLDHSMVVSRDVKGVQRFRLLEPVRQFVRQKLSPAERDEYGSNHAATFTQIAQSSSEELLQGNQELWLELLQQEVDNLRAAFRWSVEHENVESALRMMAHIWRFLEIRGYFTEGRSRAAEALRMPAADAHPLLLERTLSGAGWLAYRQADFAEAQAMIQRALALAERHQDRARILNAKNDLGNIARIRGQYSTAREYLTECLRMERDHGSPRMVAVVLYNLGAVALDEGDLQEASRKLAESLENFREQSNSREVAFPLRSLAELELLREEWELARDYAEESLTIRRALKDSKGCADTLGTMAWIEICSGNTAKATTCLSESLALAKVIGDRRTLSESLEIAALIHSHEGRAPRVVQLVAGAGRIRERLGFVLQPVRKKFVAEITAKAKGQMSDTTFQGLWQRGESRELNALVELALEG